VPRRPPRRALPHALAAGDRAEAVYAHAEAERHYATAAELARAAGDTGREAEALEKLGDVRNTLGHYSDAVQTYERAAKRYREAGGRDRSAWCTALSFRCCMAAEERERWDAGEDPLRADAAPTLSGVAPRTAARICASVALCNHMLARPSDALAAADRALAFARAAGDMEQEGMAQFFRGTSLLEGSGLEGWERLDEAFAAWTEAAKLAEAASDPGMLGRTLLHCAALQGERGAVEEAFHIGMRMLRIVEQWGAPIEIGLARLCVGETLVLVGRWAEAHAHFEAAQALLAALPPSPNSTAIVHVAWLALLQDRHEAATLVDQALTLVRQYDQTDLSLPLVRELAEEDLLAGRHETARARIEPLLQSGLPLNFNHSLAISTALRPLLAWALAERGDGWQADLSLREIVERARRVGYRPALADALRIRALLATRQGRWQEAEADLEECLALCRAMPYPYAEAKALYVYGQLHVARGESERARERYEQALAILGWLGERLYAEQVERALAALPMG
jgi:tetratricopeptide (TPR) repeat protein